MDPAAFGRLFPLGSHLCREPMPPMAELKRDMENLKRHGFNLIKLQEHWAVDEPQEGRFDFSRYEELIDHAARLDLGVYLGLTCEQAPAWLFRKHPDCRMERMDGTRLAYEATSTLPSDGKPGPCFDHPGAMKAQKRFIARLVRELGRHPNIVVWNIWQEIAYWSEAIVGQPVCFCPNTVAHFHRWLASRYGDLDGLNRAWNTRHRDWASVVPDRGPRFKTCLPIDVDWAYFMDNVQIGEVLRARAQTVRSNDPLGRPVFAHKSSPVIGSGADWTYARCLDFLGSSCYPAWAPFRRWDDAAPRGGSPVDAREALLSEAWNSVAMSYDYIRCSNRRGAPVWAAEFQGGPVSTSLLKGRVPSAQDIRRWMLTAAGSGVSAISFWVTRSEISALEVDGFSLLDSEGDSTPRLEEAARVGAALNRYPDLFGAPTAPQAPAAILINEWNWQLCQSMEGAADHLAYSVRGWHRLLWDAGCPVDFLDAGELGEPWASRYALLVLPFPLSLSEQTMQALARYVEAGGTLVSEACPGRLSEHAFATRGELSPAARTLFGVRQRALSVVREPDNGERWLPRERTWGEYAPHEKLAGAGGFDGCVIEPALYQQIFECDGSQPIFLCRGEPAGVERSAGKGRAILLGTLVGHGGTAYRSSATGAFVDRLLSRCGIGPQRMGDVLVRKRVRQDREAWLLFNPGREAAQVHLDIRGFRSVEDLLGEEIQQEGARVSLTVPSLDIRVVILGKG